MIMSCTYVRDFPLHGECIVVSGYAYVGYYTDLYMHDSLLALAIRC